MGQLRDRMEQDLILRRLSPATRRNYLLYCRKFAAHYRRPPEELEEAEIRAYLLHLIQVEQVSYATYRQIVAALKFLYTVTLARPWEVERIPFPRHRQRRFAEVLRQDQLAQLFTALRRPKCRTAALGGHRDACPSCGFTRISYNSCRDRHCPKCQATKRALWLETRLERLLPEEYCHVVFTPPQELKPLVLKNRRVIYRLLFRTASQTLLQLAADPKRLGAQIGFTAILHTWGQNLLFHPHLHCVVTGGGLSRDGQRWIPARSGYFLPVDVLARLYRSSSGVGQRTPYQQTS